MEIDKLKNKALTGAMWKFSERVFAQIISLIVSIVLARILDPEHYVSISIVTIFFTFCNAIITGGLNTALIQKKDANKEDYSSVLCISFLLSVILYIILFLTSPLIAMIFNREELILVFRVMGIILIINSIKAVYSAYVSSCLQFKKFFFMTLVGTTGSAIVGIVLAVEGYGTWALVCQQITSAVLDTVMLFFFSGIRLKIYFSWKRVRELFRYGLRIFSATIISAIYDEVSPLIIGLKFAPVHLSYYDKGKSFPSLVNSACNDTLNAVLFPAMTKVQDQKEMVLSFTRRFMRISSFCVFPVMIGFLCIAENFVFIFLSEKWLPSTIYLQLFCLVYILNFVQTGNLQAIKAIGRSDIFLKLEVLKKGIYSIVLLIAVLFAKSPITVAFAMIMNTVFATVINTYPNKKLLGYRYKMQIMDILPNFIIACVMGISVYLLTLLPIVRGVELMLQILVGMLVYIGGAVISKNESFFYLYKLVKRIIGE